MASDKSIPPKTAAGPKQSGILSQLEYWLEQGLFSARWLLAPFFVGLALSIFILLFKFAQEMIHITAIATTASGTQLVAEVLSQVRGLPPALHAATRSTAQRRCGDPLGASRL